MDMDDASRDLLVVENKKYNMKLHSLHVKRPYYRQNFADEIQTVCSMVATYDFVQSVVVTHDHVPCVMVYDNRQLSELKAFCFDKYDGSVLSFDKTYNLGKLYVTVGVYRNLALRRVGSGDVPIFIGTLFIHGNSDFYTYASFFGHLVSRLSECDSRELRLGCDEETSIRKAMVQYFPKAAPVTCTKHLKDNLVRKAHMLTASNDPQVRLP